MNLQSYSLLFSFILFSRQGLGSIELPYFQLYLYWQTKRTQNTCQKVLILPSFLPIFPETKPNLKILLHPLLPNPNYHQFITAFNRTKSIICFKTKQITLELMESNSRAFYYSGPNKNTNRQIRSTLPPKCYCFLVEKHPIVGLNKTMKK